MGPIIPFRNLRQGEAGEVVDVFGDDGLVGRLAENGLRPGTRFEAVQPGEPYLMQIGGTRLSLRCNDGLEVMVRVDA